jgi:RimJ/RimL family protein N-acetyltransferase
LRKKAHFVESLFVNETWVDDLVYALIKKDWEKLNTKNE